MSKTKEQIGELQSVAILNLRIDAVKEAFRTLNIAVAKPSVDPDREVQVQEAAQRLEDVLTSESASLKRRTGTY